MSAAFSNAEVGDDGDLIIQEGISPQTLLLTVGALALAGLVAWLVTRKGGR